MIMVQDLWATVTSNDSPYATGLLSCLSVCNVGVLYCGQTVGWIRMPLGTEVGLGPGDITLDGNPSFSPKKRGTAAPHFSAHVYCGQTVAHAATAELLSQLLQHHRAVYHANPRQPIPPSVFFFSCFGRESFMIMIRGYFTDLMSILSQGQHRQSDEGNTKRSTDPNQWPGLVLSSSTTGLSTPVYQYYYNDNN